MKSKTLTLIKTLFEDVDPEGAQEIDTAQPDATDYKDIDQSEIPTEITGNQIVNLANIMKEFIVNVSQFGASLDSSQIADIESEQITPENAMEKIEEFSRLVSQKQPDLGVNVNI